MTSASNLGVTPASSVSSAMQFAYNPIVTSQASAVAIGSLTANTSSLNVLSNLDSAAPTDFYSFNLTSGNSLKLAFNNLTQTTNLRVQVYDSVGNVVADSNGTNTQQAAFSNLTSSGGLTTGPGQYYVKVSYASGAPIYNQDYNFQLYSGSTYNSTLTTSALTQPYDPNLFTSVTSSVLPASNVTVYDRSTVLPSTVNPTTATSVGTLTPNQTALNANGAVTSYLPADEYNFNVSQNSNVKLNFSNVTNTSNLDVQILDSTGTNVIADSQGTDAQKYAYQQITSGAGYNLTAGQYVVKVGFTPGQSEASSQQYNFQLYAGSSYSDMYTTAASVPSPQASPTFQTGSNLDVYADTSATTASRSGYNTINSTAESAVNIGWIQENKTALNLTSQLSPSDNADFYSFSLQNGNNLKLNFNNTTNDSPVDIQLLDPTGTHVYADNQGTPTQKQAFADLTSDQGFSATPGNYVVKVSYGTGGGTSIPDNSVPIDYNFNVYSGTQFTTQYTTITSAQTLGNFLLGGGTLGYSATGASVGSLSSQIDQSSIFSVM